MDALTLNSIVVGAIAITSALATAWATYYFQSRETNKKHKWEIEDKEKENKCNILVNRINQIEELVSKIYNCAFEFSKFTNLNSRSQSLKTDEFEIFITFWNGSGQLNILSKVLDDKLLNTHLDKFIMNVGYLVGLLLLEPNTAVGLKDEAKYSIDLGNYIRGLDETTPEIIKRLDTLRIEINHKLPT